jgi:hypothetical protein
MLMHHTAIMEHGATADHATCRQFCEHEQFLTDRGSLQPDPSPPKTKGIIFPVSRGLKILCF